MTRPTPARPRHALLAALCLPALLAAAPRETDPTTLYLAVQTPAPASRAPVVGRGPHSYQFVVRSHLSNRLPHRNAPYQVATPDGVPLQGDESYFSGTTDAQGRTAVFRLAQPLALSAWHVQPVVGHGPNGQSFRLSTPGSARDLAGMDYMVDVLDGPLHCGRALPGGLTARFVTPGTTTLQLRNDLSQAQCQALQRQVNPVMARATPAARMAGLRQLMRQPRLARERGLLQGKLETLVLKSGTATEVRALLHSGTDPQATPAARSARLNSMGWGLVGQRPPRHLALATELLTQSVALDANRYNVGSLGWALHLQGREADALEQLNRSLALFEADCKADEYSPYVETLALRGMVLWTQRQVNEALRDWAWADLGNSDGSWTVHIPAWSQIAPLLALHRAEMPDDAPVPRCLSGDGPPDSAPQPAEAGADAPPAS